MNLGPVPRTIDRAPQEEQKQPAASKGIPGLEFGGIKPTPNDGNHQAAAAHENNNRMMGGAANNPSASTTAVIAKPKIGFGLGLDLRKAQQLQQEHLTMAEEKKSHARETAGQHKGGLNFGGQIPRLN